MQQVMPDDMREIRDAIIAIRTTILDKLDLREDGAISLTGAEGDSIVCQLDHIEDSLDLVMRKATA